MSDATRRELESLERIVAFKAENNAVIKDFAIAVGMFTNLIELIAQLEAKSATKASSGSSRTGATLNKTSAESRLERHLRGVATTADVIAEREPDFDNRFDFPQGSVSFSGLLALADSYLANLPPVEAKFISYGKSANFIADIAEAKADCETFLTVQDTGQRGSVEANADEAAILKAALAIKKPLKTIVNNLFETDAGKLANWRSACHVERAPKKKDPGSGGGGGTPPTP